MNHHQKTNNNLAECSKMVLPEEQTCGHMIGCLEEIVDDPHRFKLLRDNGGCLTIEEHDKLTEKFGKELASSVKRMVLNREINRMKPLPFKTADNERQQSETVLSYQSINEKSSKSQLKKSYDNHTKNQNGLYSGNYL